MMDEERRTFTDSDGLLRIQSKYGFNGFTSADDAYHSAKKIARHSTLVHVWLTDDGVYTATLSEDTDAARNKLPELKTATLLESRR